MAFKLAESALSGVLSVESLSNDEEYIARVYIGLDHETGAVYSAVVSLTYRPHLGAGRMELVFGITEAFPDGLEPVWINDGAATKRFLRGADREAVLNCICTAALMAADAARPEVITYVTAVPYLPNKALTKYGHICQAIKSVGYRGGQGSEYHGSHIWMLERGNDGT